MQEEREYRVLQKGIAVLRLLSFSIVYYFWYCHYMRIRRGIVKQAGVAIYSSGSAKMALFAWIFG